MKNLLIAILWLVIPLAAQSQRDPKPTFKIKGQIMDSINFSSIPFATITITKMPENKVERRVAANIDGVFEASLKSDGEYELVANSLGYTAVKKSFSVNNTSQTVDLGKLTLKQSSVELKEVQVIGEKPLVKIESDKLSYNAESDPDTKTANTLDLLKKVPFVTVDGDDNVQVKGATNFKVFINGKPSTMASNNPRDFKNFPASSIKNIEVITSPGAKYDAEGVGGIINIITQKKSSMTGYNGVVNAATNTLGAVSGGINLSASYGKVGFSLDLANYYQDFPYFKNTQVPRDFDVNKEIVEYTMGDGKSKYRGTSPWGTGEFSYEIDTLNLVSASFSMWMSNYQNTTNTMVNTQDNNMVDTKRYNMYNVNKTTFGAPEGNIDYQKTSKKNKEQVFTLSYKLNYNPTGYEYESNIDGIFNYDSRRQISKNSAYTAEHTFQTDFVKPLNASNKIEMGLKYILRKNVSITDVSIYDYTLQQFVGYPAKENDFDYTQNIFASYLSYSKKIKKFDLKVGIRLEDVFTNGTFTSLSYTDFKYTNLEFVPSATISYQINDANNVRLSYNKRIQRPSIWYLNPFVDDSDPLFIRYGNPNLDPERFHNFELNFGRFSKMGNINMTLYNSFSNNAIDRVSDTENGVTKSTFSNVNTIQTWGLSSFISLRFGTKVNASVNGFVNYNVMEGNNSEGLTNEGWGYNAFTNIQYTIIKGLKLTGFGMFFKPPVRLQSKTSTFYNVGMSLGKEFFNNKMTLTLFARNIFWKEMKFSFTTTDPTYYQESEMYRAGRYFSVSLRYKFGDMNSQIKKAKRGIRNDDVKSGEGGGNNGGN